MVLCISDKKLRRALEDGTVAARYGADMAKKIMLRVNALEAADSLGDFWPPNSGPERCHELKGGLVGTFSIDLKQPYRLLFKAIEPSPSLDRADEQKRWNSINSIDVVGIEDTHG